MTSLGCRPRRCEPGTTLVAPLASVNASSSLVGEVRQASGALLLMRFDASLVGF
jgi:hypothetical protein